MGTPSATVAVTGIGTSSGLALASGQRSAVTFHNPNAAISLIVCQTTDSSGSALAATFAAPAGGFVILAGAERKFVGNVQTAWNVAGSASGPSTLTIWIDT
jgi:hypothetical protein